MSDTVELPEERRRIVHGSAAPWVTEKRCSKCGVTKPTIEFGVNHHRGGRIRSSCKACESEYKKTYQVRVQQRDHIEPDTIQCVSCGQRKFPEQFNKNIQNITGRQSECRSCNGEKRWLFRSKNSERFRERSFTDKLKRNFNLTIEDYNKMVLDQNGVCKICGQPETSKVVTRLSVDHCHSTGKVRGLLCKSCNSALGQAKDNIDLLHKMIDYLKEHSQVGALG
jgi:hypothetical protein